MNPYLTQLEPYPFEKLAQLIAGISPAGHPPVALSIGEPKHAPPAFVLECLQENLGGVANYPPTRGSAALRETIANWLSHRYKLPENSLNIEKQILPVNGTREALFSFAQCVLNPSLAHKNTVLMPNPFYQIYEGATLLAGLKPAFYPLTRQTGYQLPFDAISSADWKACQLVYICSPNNPTGSVMSIKDMQRLIELAEKYDFLIASDECYSEIYSDESTPPCGLLKAAAAMGNTEYKRCAVFHSLSKRSNLPGLRSGFVAGDAHVMEAFYRYRTYHGCAMAPPVQAASVAAWKDEDHVQQNRQAYREKFDAVINTLQGTLSVTRPDAGFYLWPELPIDDTVFTQNLYKNHHILTLPGSYLARRVNGENPGSRHIRIALVAPLKDCVSAAQTIGQFSAAL
ncbi:MAG TPA: succinyldiaminopimelate transaminase [Gammaproteobacteria bacterium]|nr:succinyldiaminopimelate transaminase [Gammaproteobacteria bacterium]